MAKSVAGRLATLLVAVGLISSFPPPVATAAPSHASLEAEAAAAENAYQAALACQVEARAALRPAVEAEYANRIVYTTSADGKLVPQGPGDPGWISAVSIEVNSRMWRDAQCPDTTVLRRAAEAAQSALVEATEADSRVKAQKAAEAKLRKTAPTIDGGTSAQRARLKKVLKRYGLWRNGQRFHIVSSNGTGGHWGVAGATYRTVTVTVSGRSVKVPVRTGDIKIRKDVVAGGGNRLTYVALHEASHGLQFIASGDRSASGLAAKTTKLRRYHGMLGPMDVQADCMVQTIAGKGVARRSGSYLKRWGETCSAKELKEARRIVSATR